MTNELTINWKRGKYYKQYIKQTWPTRDRTDEIRKQIKLKEKDARIMRQTLENVKKRNEELLLRLRDQNKNDTIYLADILRSDTHIIHTVYRSRPYERLALRNLSAQTAIQYAFKRVCDAFRNLSLFQFKHLQRENRISRYYQKLSDIELMADNSGFEKHYKLLRITQNNTDKICIKLEVAQNLTKMYQKILEEIKEECSQYPKKLDLMEKAIKDANEEKKQLEDINKKAIISAEKAKKSEREMEAELYDEKQQRNLAWHERKRLVDKKRDFGIPDKNEKKLQMITLEEIEKKISELKRQKLEEQEKILTVEEEFEKIRNTCDLSDANDFLERIRAQELMTDHLKKLEAAATDEKVKLEEEATLLRRMYHDLKYTSERRNQVGRQLVEETEKFLLKEELRKSNVLKKREFKEKLLIDVENGISALFKKLSTVHLKPPLHNYSKQNSLDDLITCSLKIEQLIQSVGTNPEKLFGKKVFASEKLFIFMVKKQPLKDICINVNQIPGLSADLIFDDSVDNDRFVTREFLKNREKEIIHQHATLKPKKK